MRMRKKPNLVPRMEACSEYWIQNPEAYRGKWRELMPQCSQLRVEVGCGKGEFTVKTAEAEPDILLIAVEIVKDAMWSVLQWMLFPYLWQMALMNLKCEIKN